MASRNGERPDAPHSATPEELKARIEAERAGVPFLLYRDAEEAQQLVLLEAEPGRVTVGRRETNDVVLDWDKVVSRAHAELESVGAVWAVVDAGLSQNGTYVNGVRVRGRRRLHDRDLIRFGHTLVVFRAPGLSSASVTAADVDSPLDLAELTNAQQRVLAALCRPYFEQGHAAAPASNQEIADGLVLSVAAVKSLLRGLFQRAGLAEVPQNQKRARLAELALAAGIQEANR